MRIVDIKTQRKKVPELKVSDLGLCSIESDGLCGDSSPKQGEGLHVAHSLGDLSNSDVGVRAMNLRMKQFKVPCSG